jgi:hypothetical protein
MMCHSVVDVFWDSNVVLPFWIILRNVELVYVVPRKLIHPIHRLQVENVMLNGEYSIYTNTLCKGKDAWYL